MAEVCCYMPEERAISVIIFATMISVATMSKMQDVSLFIKGMIL
jgi:hypothetical protein